MAKESRASKLAERIRNIRTKDMLVAAVFCLILANAAVYAFMHLEGISGYGDDPTYANLGVSVVQGTFKMTPTYIFSVRLTEAFAIGLFYLLFGISNFSVALWSIAAYLCLIAVAFYTGRFFHNDNAGLVSAFLVSIFPLVTKYATTVNDDIPLALFASLAVLLFLYGERDKKHGYYLLSGVMLVLAWLTSYEAALAIAFVLLYAVVGILRKRIRVDKTFASFPLGIAAAFAIVFVYSYVNCGQPFVTITTNARFYSAVGQFVDGYATIPSATTDLSFYIKEMFPYKVIESVTTLGLQNAINYFDIQMFSGGIYNFEYGLYFYLLLPAIAVLLLRDKNSYFLVFWFAFLWLGLEFGPMHVDISLNPPHITYLLAHRLYRFMLIATVPISCILSIGLLRLWEKRRRVWGIAGFLFFAVILALLYMSNYAISNYWYYYQHYPAELMMQATNFIKAMNPQGPIYLESYYNYAYVGYIEGAESTYLGMPLSNQVNYSIGSNVSCDRLLANAYIVWAGPPHCRNWVNVLNITQPKDIPEYLIRYEDPVLGYKITNVYLIRGA
ncbi:MAG: glycosyltransferase family 39 protein [Candidatus Micrarchaeota archaeon]|nr:glycosyltransferase family 39 protein [Candidatus Micrarchaeota archaeon]